MLLGLDASIWNLLLVILLFPVLAVALLNVILRKRGGIGAGWGGALVVLLAGLMALLVIFDKVKL
ncbi:MAG: hypothetical protein KBG99_02325 [Pseudoxanthomonas sp.]|nr:hypothetical protein [Pseudoxanthomonas sp.]MBP8803193.1 hypothetical protein [Pseudoxanthomonas sp.]MBP8908223.1 hypothetical protein [Pseudoxanthomonas sp.]MBP9535116.1 hypothetical protein [Pseudoxanthomonas sp.]